MIQGYTSKNCSSCYHLPGLAYRRGELVWVNGNQIGAKFIKRPDKKKHAERTSGEKSTV
jgi:hypothetical protein